MLNFYLKRSCQTCMFVLEIHLFYQHDTLRCVCVCAAVFYPRRVFHQTPPQQTRHHLQLLLGLLDVGVQLEDFLQVAAGWQVVLPQRCNIKIRRISNHIKTQMGRFTAPANPCEPALVCRRPSCCSAPAAEPSHSPVWPLQSDSASGSKWLWRAAKTQNYLCHSGWSIRQQFTLSPHSEVEYFRVRTCNLRKCGQQEHTCKRKWMQTINI